MALDFAMEGIGFSISSPLGSALEAAFEEVIALRDKMQEKNELSLSKQIDVAFKYFDETTVPKVQKTINDKIGYNLTKIYRFRNPTWASFATAWSAYGANTMQSLPNNLGAHIRYPAAGGRKLIKFIAGYDPNTMTIDPKYRAEFAKCFKVEMFFDFPLGFYAHLLSGQLYQHEVCLTARELTAIVLHEIGHAITTIDHAVDGYLRLSTISQMAQSQARTLEFSEIIEAMREAVKTYEKDLPKDLAKTCHETLAKVGDETTFQPTEEFKQFVGGVIGSVFSALPVAIYGLFIGTGLLKGPDQYRKPGEQSTKIGDLLLTFNDYQREEILADKYTALHGYGKDQVTALLKIERIIHSYVRGGDETRALEDAMKVGKTLFTFGSVVDFLNELGTARLDPHPKSSERAEHLAKAAIEALRKAGTDQQLINFFTTQYSDIINETIKLKAHDVARMRGIAFRRFLSNYLSIPGFFDMLLNGRLRKELRDELAAIDNLMNNPFHYYKNILK